MMKLWMACLKTQWNKDVVVDDMPKDTVKQRWSCGWHAQRHSEAKKLCYGWQAISLLLTGRYLMRRAWVRRMMQRLTTPSNCKNNVHSLKSCMFCCCCFNWIHAVIIITVELVWKSLKCVICPEVTLCAWCQTFPFIFLVWHRESIIPGNLGFATTKY